jgi:hypothetical protein
METEKRQDRNQDINKNQSIREKPKEVVLIAELFLAGTVPKERDIAQFK